MPGFAVIYRWRLKPGMEAQFVEAWSRITELYIAQRGGLGSRLHKGPDDIWYTYAQWATAQARIAAFAGESLDAAAGTRMREAVAERFDEIVFEPVADLLVPRTIDARTRFAFAVRDRPQGKGRNSLQNCMRVAKSSTGELPGRKTCHLPRQC